MFEKVNPVVIWREIPGFEDYLVSSNGDVFSKKHGIILKQYEKKKYLYVFLYGENGRKHKSVHRLVAEAFIDNPYRYPEVNHRDENTRNNHVENLEWCTGEYNRNYGTLPERRRKRSLENNPFRGLRHTEASKEKMRAAKLGKPSMRKRQIEICGKKYDSVKSALQELHISTRRLYKLIKEEEYVREV